MLSFFKKKHLDNHGINTVFTSGKNDYKFKLIKH